MSTVTIENAQAHLSELIDQMQPGEEIVILRSDLPIAKLVGQSPERPQRSRPGFMKGTVISMAPDFDAPLEDFKEYME